MQTLVSGHLFAAESSSFTIALFSQNLSCLAIVLVSRSARHFCSDIRMRAHQFPPFYVITSCDQHRLTYIFVACFSYLTFLATRVCTAGLKFCTNARDTHVHRPMHGFQDRAFQDGGRLRYTKFTPCQDLFRRSFSAVQHLNG